MKIVCLLVLSVLGLSNVQAGREATLDDQLHFLNLNSLTKLNKVLNWLVIEDPKKEDKDLQLMHSEPERIDKFVDFVLAHQDLCKAKEKDVTCKELRQAIDQHKDEAGTEGIDFDKRISGFIGFLARRLSLRNSDVIKPYGVNVLIDWILETAAGIPTRLVLDRSKVFKEPNAALKFVIKNKDKLWSIIKASATDDELLDGYDQRELAKFLADHAEEMGFTYTTPSEWNSNISILKFHNLFSDKPENHMSLSESYVSPGRQKAPRTTF